MNTEQTATAWPLSSDFEDVRPYWDEYVVQRDIMFSLGAAASPERFRGCFAKGKATVEQECAISRRLVALDQALRAERLIAEGYVDLSERVDRSRLGGLAVVPPFNPTFFIDLDATRRTVSQEEELIASGAGRFYGRARVLVLDRPVHPHWDEYRAAVKRIGLSPEQGGPTVGDLVGEIHGLQGPKEREEIERLLTVDREVQFDQRCQAAQARGFQSLRSLMEPGTYRYAEAYVTSLDGDGMTLDGYVTMEDDGTSLTLSNHLCRIEVIPGQVVFVKPFEGGRA